MMFHPEFNPDDRRTWKCGLGLQAVPEMLPGLLEVLAWPWEGRWTAADYDWILDNLGTIRPERVQGPSGPDIVLVKSRRGSQWAYVPWRRRWQDRQLGEDLREGVFDRTRRPTK